LPRDNLGFPDDSGYIPAARWTRAMTFEHLVRDARCASEVAPTAVGRVALDRTTMVVTVNARVHVEETADLLAAAHVLPNISVVIDRQGGIEYSRHDLLFNGVTSQRLACSRHARTATRARFAA